MKRKMYSLSKQVSAYIIIAAILFGLSVALAIVTSLFSRDEHAMVIRQRETVERAKESFEKALIEIETTVNDIAIHSEMLYELNNMGNGLEKQQLEWQYYKYLSDILKISKSSGKDVYIFVAPTENREAFDVWLTRDEAGRIYRHDMTPSEDYKTYKNLGWYEAIEIASHSKWMNIYRNRYGDTIVSYLKPIYYHDTMIGVVGMDLESSEIAFLLEQLNRGKESFFWVVDGEDAIIYHPGIYEGVALENTNYNLYGSGWDTSYSLDVIDGKAYRHFISFTSNQWKFVYTVDESVFSVVKLDLLKRVSLVFILLLIPFLGVNQLFTQSYRKRYNTIVEILRRNQDDGRREPVLLELNTDGVIVTEAINRSYFEIEELKGKIDQLTYRNRITGLPNWVKMREELEVILSEERGNFVTVFDIDLDFFKKINEIFGHHIGDEVLETIGKELKKLERNQLKFFHTDGDAFIAIVIGIPCEKIHLVAEEIQQVISGITHIHGYDINLSSSMGIACSPDHGQTSEELLKYAEVALYSSKHHGKNRFSIFQPMMFQKLRDIKALEDGFKKAIKEQQFVVHYQPKFNPRKQVVGIEALVRWNHPEKGLLYPDFFIDYAEQTGLIVDIGEIVLREACRTFKALKMINSSLEHVAVNISSRQLLESDFEASVLKILQEESLQYDYLELEVTESMLIYDRENSIEKLMSLKQQGIAISLDDFGTGYASINNIKNLPLSRLKIDRTFIEDIDENPRVIKMLESIVKMAHDLELFVTAEGVETPRQFSILEDCVIDEFQGYLLAKPMDVKALREFLLTIY